jgi:hypothetical protein
MVCRLRGRLPRPCERQSRELISDARVCLISVPRAHARAYCSENSAYLESPRARVLLHKFFSIGKPRDFGEAERVG